MGYSWTKDFDERMCSSELYTPLITSKVNTVILIIVDNQGNEI